MTADEPSQNPLGPDTVNEITAVLNNARALRAEGALADYYLDFEANRPRLRDELKKIQDTDDALLDRAIGMWQETDRAFQEPDHDLRYALAGLYIRRRAIAKAGAAGLGGLAVIGVALAGAKAMSNARERGREHAVEAAVAEAYQEYQSIADVAESFQAAGKVLPEGERSRFDAATQEAQRRLDLLKSGFFDKYAGGGDAEEGVTVDNYREAQAGIAAVKSQFPEVEGLLSANTALLHHHERLAEVNKDLEALVAEFRNLGTPAWQDDAETAYKNGVVAVQARNLEKAEEYAASLRTLNSEILALRQASRELDALYEEFKNLKADAAWMTDAEKAYNNGKVSVRARDLQKADGYRNDLEGLNAAIGEFREVSNQLESAMAQVRSTQVPWAAEAETEYRAGKAAVNSRDLEAARTHYDKIAGMSRDWQQLEALIGAAQMMYEDIRAIAKEDAALVKADELYRSAQRHAKAFDEHEVSRATEDLAALDEELNLEYTLVVVGGTGRGDTERYGDPAKDPNAEFYAKVEAHTDDGRVVPRRIKNEETGQVELVEQWGDQITREQFEKYWRDRDDNKIIDDNYFGRKRKGYLTEERKFPDRGQITKY